VVDLGSKVYVYQEGAEMGVFADAWRSGGADRMVYRLPLALFAFPATHLFHAGPLSGHYQRHATTDLDAIPLYASPELDLFHTLMNVDLWSARNVRNGKWYEITYGFRPRPDPRSAFEAVRFAGGRAIAAVRGFIARVGRLAGYVRRPICGATIAST
jgi:hypothetical protein